MYQVYNVDIAHDSNVELGMFSNAGKVMDRLQINVRITKELAGQLDAKRIELQESMGKIPSRSEVVRLAVEQYLRSDSDHREETSSERG